MLQNAHPSFLLQLSSSSAKVKETEAHTVAGAVHVCVKQ